MAPNDREGCSLGSRNAEAISNNKTGIARNDRDILRIYDTIEKIKNRPPIWATFLITALASATTALMMALVKHAP